MCCGELDPEACAGGTSFGRTDRAMVAEGLSDNIWALEITLRLTSTKSLKRSKAVSTDNQEVYLTGYDENAGAGQVYIYSAKVKLYYTYTVAAQDGDIVAGGRIYANSTQSVGDVAEYFPVNDGVEIGHIIASEPGKSNYYKLADDPYCNHLVGVISNEPSVVLNDPSVGPPVGLTGRVNVKLVDSENLIKSGDFITSSNQKGLGQLANV